MLYIANAVIIANWYGPIKIEVDGIIQASAMKQIIKSVTDQCRLYPNPCIVIKKFKHSKNHIPKDANKAANIFFGASITSNPLKNELHVLFI